MKKNHTTSAVIAVAVLAVSFFLLNRPAVLGSLQHSYTVPTTVVSSVSFAGTTGETVRFSFRSEIQSGDLAVILYDSAGRVVYTLDKAKALETDFTLEQSDTYTLAAECSALVGAYQIFVSKAN